VADIRTLQAMAENPAHHHPSRRFIKAYLFAWGLLAAGGLTYLGTLAWQPDWLSPPPPRPQVVAEPEPDPALRMATRAIAEIRDVRRSVGDVQRTVGEIKDTLDQNAADNRAVHTRLTAIEGRVSEIAAQETVPVAAAPVAAPPKQKTAEKTQHKIVAAPKSSETQAATRVLSATMSVPDQAAKPAPEPAARAIETGSIKQAPIAFGEPVVTRSSTNFAIQLGAGRSLDALKLSWSLLLDQHGDALQSLEPRLIAPRTEGTSYRLVAGPFDTRAEAEKVCAAMNLSRNKCFSTIFAGEPL
jgi:cell division protein FtsN